MCISCRKQEVYEMNEESVYNFLCEVDKNFPVPLSEKVDLREYAKKLVNKAEICCITEENRILSVAAGYMNNADEEVAFLAVVATSQQARGKGMASALVKEFIDKARARQLKGVHLYTDKRNSSAISIYTKLGFVDYIIDNEPRPDDVHLVYWIDGSRQI